MNLIEKAAQRLEQLARTEVAPEQAAADPAPLPPPQLRVAAAAPVAALHGLERVRPSEHRAVERPMVTLDLPALARRGLLVDPSVRSLLAEEFRALKLEVLSQLARRDERRQPLPPIVMVASALPGEGKTFCATNLALSLAMDVDREVLLVDADVVRGQVLPLLGVQARPPGLLELLADDNLRAQEHVLGTNLRPLSILPPGQPTPRATELLASRALDRLLEELASHAPERIIVMDSTPLLLTAEAKVVAARAGLVLVVVEADHTPLSTVTEAFELLRDLPSVVAVLNKRRKPQRDPTSYYGYG